MLEKGTVGGQGERLRVLIVQLLPLLGVVSGTEMLAHGVKRGDLYKGVVLR